MNTIKNIFRLFCLCAIGMLAFTACNDDFLDKSPEDRVSDNVVWKTPNDLKLYVNNFYNNNSLLPFYDGFSNDAIWMTVDAVNGSDIQTLLTENVRMNGASAVPESGGDWAISDWSVLSNINTFFANYEKVTTGDQAEINRYVGEALFFRAIFYFDKLRRFGDVPWYDNLLGMDDEALYKARDPRNVVVANLMTDLDKAVSYLPSRGANAEWNGRVNKETAMLLQARIALYEGAWEKYHAGTVFGVTGSDNGAAFIQKAATVTDALMTLGTCDLDNMGVADGYFKLFNQTSYAGSKEVLFWRQYQIGVKVHKWHRYTYNGMGSGLTKRMIDYYLCTDGKPITGNALYREDATLVDVVANRDARLAQTIFVNDGAHLFEAGSAFTYPMFSSAPTTKAATGYQLYKGHNPAQNATQDGTTAMIYFRYAEALLINAEAKAELGQFTQAVADATINKLRDRVGMAHLNVSEIGTFPKQFPALSAEINEVRRERAVELVAEGFRTDDIFRWAAADELIVNYEPLGAKRAQWEGITEDPYLGANIADLPIDANGYIRPLGSNTNMNGGYKFNVNRDYLQPLPITERVLNPKLAQNPGWTE